MLERLEFKARCGLMRAVGPEQDAIAYTWARDHCGSLEQYELSQGGCMLRQQAEDSSSGISIASKNDYATAVHM